VRGGHLDVRPPWRRVWEAGEEEEEKAEEEEEEEEGGTWLGRGRPRA